MSRSLSFYLGLLLLCINITFLGADNTPKPVSNDKRINETDILAEFDGGVITRKDVEAKISKLPVQYQARYKTVEGQTEVLNAMAMEEVFYKKAQQMGLENDPIVLERIANIEKRFYIQEYYKRNVSDLVVITEDDLQSYYNQNMSQFYLNPYIEIDYLQAADENEAKKALE